MKRKYETPQTRTIHIEISNMIMKSPPDDEVIENPFKEPEEGDADGACAKNNNNNLWE